MLEEWKVRQRILNLGIDRRDIEKWFNLFFSRRDELFSSFPQKLSVAKMFLDAGFKNPYLVEKIFEKCKDRSDVPCLQKVIEIYKGYKEEYMSLGLDELEAERWAKVFDNKGKDYCREGWKSPEVVFRFERKFEEVNKIVEEFLVDGLSKEEVFFALERAGIWQKGKVDYDRLQSFREKHQPRQHPILTFALLQTNKPFQELSLRLQFYTTLGFSSLSAQEWVAAELIYNRKLTEYEITTLLSAGINEGFVALRWLKEFPLEEAIRWYVIKWHSIEGLSPLGAKFWEVHGFSPEIAGALWKVGVEPSRELARTIEKYDIEHFKELALHLEKVAMDAEGIEFWLFIDRQEHKMKDWIALGINYYSLVQSLENQGFTLEKVKTLLDYCSLEELLEEVQKGKSYEEVYEHFHNRYIVKKVYPTVLKQFKKKR